MKTNVIYNKDCIEVLKTSDLDNGCKHGYTSVNKEGIKMISKELNVGRSGEYLVLFDLLSKGYQCFDTAQGVNYDLVMQDKDGVLIKIQVKSTKCPKEWGYEKYEKINPSYHFHTKRAGKGAKRFHTESEFELYALAMLDIKTVAYIPNRGLACASITLRDKNIKYYSEYNGKYYQDLTIESALEYLKLNPLPKTKQEKIIKNESSSLLRNRIRKDINEN